MNKMILFIFYAFFLSAFYSSFAIAFSSADFGDDSYNTSSIEYENVSNNTNDNDDRYRSETFAENTRPDPQYEYYASNQSPRHYKTRYKKPGSSHGSYYSRLPGAISGYGEKVIIINPRKHVWGAYSSDGKLLRAGLATAGSGYCRDIHRACRTRTGTFRIQSLGSASCYSKRYPVGRGGAPMPYCMFFNGNQGLHGSHEVVEGNVSHGCVRISVSDAQWVRFNFANIGTKLVVTSY